jgi:hypothetical protein
VAQAERAVRRATEPGTARERRTVERPESSTDRRRRALAARPRTVALGAIGLLVLLSLVRVISGAEDITSSGTASAALRLAVPIGLAGLGGLWAERAGIVNIGLEGMLILGTWFGAWAAFFYGPWIGRDGGRRGRRARRPAARAGHRHLRRRPRRVRGSPSTCWAAASRATCRRSPTATARSRAPARRSPRTPSRCRG